MTLGATRDTRISALSHLIADHRITMPRMLPWKTGTPTIPKKPRASQPRPSPPPAARPPKRRKPTPAAPTAADDDLDPGNISPMRPTDDQWMMVEDEFLATAQLFTRRLRRSEYAALAEAVAAASRDRVTAIQRPVDEITPLSASAKMRLRATELRKRQSRALGPLKEKEEEKEDDEEEEDEALANSEIGNMIRAHGSQSQRDGALRGRWNARPVLTRARAGFKDAGKDRSRQERDKQEEWQSYLNLVQRSRNWDHPYSYSKSQSQSQSQSQLRQKISPPRHTRPPPPPKEKKKEERLLPTKARVKFEHSAHMPPPALKAISSTPVPTPRAASPPAPPRSLSQDSSAPTTTKKFVGRATARRLAQQQQEEKEHERPGPLPTVF